MNRRQKRRKLGNLTKSKGDRTMAVVQETYAEAEVRNQANVGEVRHERWAHVPIHWSAVWVGALAAFSVVVLFGLIGIAVGAHAMGPADRVVDLGNMGIGALIFSVCGAFFAFVVGGWVAGKVAGILHSEPGMVQGAVVWLAAVPVLVAAGALGAGSLFGGWYGGLSGGRTSSTSPYVRPEAPTAGATTEEVATYRTQRTEYVKNVKQWDEDTPRVTRNVALGAVTALLLGLVGAVIGGWLSSGEPMNFSHHRTRKAVWHHPA
jgi:hypothetical protein